MADVKFNPKAKTSANALYEVLSKYGSKILKTDEAKEINKTIAEIFLNVYLDEPEEMANQLKRLNAFSALEQGKLSENVRFFEDHSADSPLKTLNSAILDILHGGRINQESIDFILSKMKERRSTSRMRSKTYVALGDGVKERYKKEAKGLLRQDIEIDQRKLGLWVNEVLEKGIEAVIKDDSWGDHKLDRDGEFKGRRSVRLSFAGRVIYTLEQEIQEDVVVNKVTIVRITSAHDYR